MMEKLISELGKDSLERLKWLVLREFSVLPGSRAARKMREGDVIFCAVNMLLDRRRGGAERDENPVFDNGRSRELGGGL